MNINAISCGQGAPSLYLIVMAREGLIKADVVITADTGWENDMLWSNGKRTTAKEYFLEVTKPLAKSAGLHAVFVRSLDKHGKPYQPLCEVTTGIPFYGSDGGRLRQACTSRWKIKAIRQELRRRQATTAITFLGMTLSETHRLKNSDVKWTQHSYPLITFGLYRSMIVSRLDTLGIPYLVTTECDGCPHKDAARWLRTSQKTINELAEYEKSLGGEFFLTPLRIPLKEAVAKMRYSDNAQISFFDSCDGGYCGV